MLYDGAPPRLGRSLEIETDRYAVAGLIRAVGDSSTLPTETTSVVVRDYLDADQADAIAVGDAITIEGRTVATVEDVTQYRTDASRDRRVFVGLSLETLTYGSTPRYGARPVRTGSSLQFHKAEYRLDGPVVRVGATEEPGTPATRTLELAIDAVPADRANQFRVGMTESAGSDTVAEVVAVDVQPTTVVVTTDDGELRVRDHPIDRDVTLTVGCRSVRPHPVSASGETRSGPATGWPSS